mgnify:CR=1 FL=1
MQPVSEELSIYPMEGKHIKMLPGKMQPAIYPSLEKQISSCNSKTGLTMQKVVRIL